MATKDALLVGEANTFSNAAYADAYDTTTLWAGRTLIFSKVQSPPQIFDRYRSLISFPTSGFRDVGWVESVRLELYVVDSLSQYTTKTGITSAGTDYNFELYTVSGTSNRNLTYTSSYGFGDSVGDYLNPPDDWGPTRINPDPTLITELVRTFSFYDILSTAGGINYRINSIPYRSRYKTISMNIPITYLNNLGESHFRLVTEKEYDNVPPGNVSTQLSQLEYAVFASADDAVQAHRPKLVVTYVVPGAGVAFTDLRATDLNLNYTIQKSINASVASGARVLDGYPEDVSVFSNERNVSLEHIASVEGILEIGSHKQEIERAFMVDVICDRRGELDDTIQVITESIKEGVPYYDFRYGFINPPQVGTINVLDIDVIHIEPLVINDMTKYHSVVFFNTKILGSGL